MAGLESTYWNRAISRRSLLRGGGVAGAGLAGAALLGCGDSEGEPSGGGNGGSSPGAGGTSAALSTAEGEPRSGGVLRFGMPTGPEADSLAVGLGGSGTFGQHYGGALFDTLVTEDPDKNIVGHLAESWEDSPDFLSRTFTLRQDVTFHDGKPFTAHNVKAVFDWAMDEANTLARPSIKSDVGRILGGVDVVDDYTVTLTLTQPLHTWLRRMTRLYYAQPSTDALLEMGIDQFGRNPVGSGPFVFENWVQASEVSMKRNPDYRWPQAFVSQGMPYLDGLRYLEIPDPDSRFAALVANDVDAIDELPPVQLDDVRQNAEMKTFEALVQADAYKLQLNLRKPPMDDLRVRQALNHVVNKQEISDLIHFNMHPIADGGNLSPTVPLGYVEGLFGDLYPFDLEQAAQLLDAAGWVSEGGGVRRKDGQELRFSYLSYTPELAQLIQTQIAQVGMAMDIVIEPLGTAYDDRELAAQDHLMDDGDEQAGYKAPDADALHILYHSSRIDGVNGRNEFVGYINPELDEVLEQQRAVPDGEERRQLLVRAQEILAENAVSVPLFYGNKVVPAHQRVNSIRIEASNFYLSFDDAWMT